ncbi:MAG TPA: hypothetical protein HA279_01815 [Candidatus Poseidoniaceae archaeon]|nr:hypothetical protein [Candidatus Poseidoniaceae archaeon]
MNNQCIQICLVTILLVCLSGSNAEQVEGISTQQVDSSFQNVNESEVFVVTVDSTNLRFTPDSITVTEKDSVRFFWSDEILPHNAVERNGLFDSGETARNVDYTYTFEVGENGTYEYICEPHEAVGMIGTIVVEPLPENQEEAEVLPDDKDEMIEPQSSAINSVISLGLVSIAIGLSGFLTLASIRSSSALE